MSVNTHSHCLDIGRLEEDNNKTPIKGNAAKNTTASWVDKIASTKDQNNKELKTTTARNW